MAVGNSFTERRRVERREAVAVQPCQFGVQCHEAMELRLQKIELELSLFNDDLTSHAKAVGNVTEALNDIQKTLHSIKFTVFGAIGIYAYQLVGVEGLIKHFFGN